MKFEVINDKNKTIYYTYKIEDIPQKEDLASINNAGYKFKIDGRIASRKKIEELKNENTDKISQQKHTQD